MILKNYGFHNFAVNVHIEKNKFKRQMFYAKHTRWHYFKYKL